MTHSLPHTVEDIEAHEHAANDMIRENVQAIIEDPYALSNAWAKGHEFKKPFDHTIENSGQRVKLRRLDMGDLLKLGVAEELDFMTKGLMSEDNPKDSAKEAVESVILKAGNFANMEKMINTVCLAGILAPKLHAVPLHENARQPGLVYIDSVPFADRMELFSMIFESEGLSTFREEQKSGVGNVADVPSVQLPADGSVALRPDNA